MNEPNYIETHIEEILDGRLTGEQLRALMIIRYRSQLGLPITTKVISDDLGAGRSTVRRAMAVLRKLNYLEALDTKIYFIQRGHDGPIKIGRGDNPKKRLRQLQTASPEPLNLLGEVCGSMEFETWLHRKFRHLNISGEWFKPDSELVEYICRIKDSDEH